MTDPERTTDQRAATVVVDAANCVGSVPDGWWRDRAAATRRLRDSLSSDALRHDLQLAATPALVLVVEGRARGVESTATVRAPRAATRVRSSRSAVTTTMLSPWAVSRPPTAAQ